MAYEQRDYAGGAVQTTLTAGISATDLSIVIDSSTGWPSGGANGPFFVVIDRGFAGEEKVEIASRTGTTLTVASTLKRGVDGTSAGTHASGATIAHCFTAQDADEANSHITNTGLDHHTQYLNTTRHAAVSHTQAMLGTDSVGAAQIQVNAVGASELANNAVDTAAIVDEAVTSAKIEDDAVVTAKILDENVTTAKIADLNVTSAKLAADAVIAGKIADGAVDVTGSLADGIITMAKFASEAGTSYTPDFPNVTIGTPSPGGVKYGRYFKFGRLVFGIAGFHLGTGGNVTGQITFTTPDGTNIFDPLSSASSTGWVAAARCADVSAAAVYSGMGVISDTGVVQNFVTAGAAANWDATTPFNWDPNDVFQALFVYETNS